MKSRLEMVGPNGLEPSTSSVSGKRSNQLSYGPIAYGVTSLTQTIRPRNSNRSQGPQRYGVKAGTSSTYNNFQGCWGLRVNLFGRSRAIELDSYSLFWTTQSPKMY